MNELIKLITDANAITFILLFVRFSALFIFLPIFRHTVIPVSIKTAISLFFTFLFFSSVEPVTFELDATLIVAAVVNEMLFGLIAGLILNIVVEILMYAGELISFVMGFSMATAYDPSNGTQSPIISSFLGLIALMVLLATDMHHYMIQFIDISLSRVPLGGLVLEKDIINYIIDAMSNFFQMGLTIAFPIIALSLLMDIIFGMLMKTMPQFNLLVIGFPIKIGVAFWVIITVLTSYMLIFKHEFLEAFNAMRMLF